MNDNKLRPEIELAPPPAVALIVLVSRWSLHVLIHVGFPVHSVSSDMKQHPELNV